MDSKPFFLTNNFEFYFFLLFFYCVNLILLCNFCKSLLITSGKSAIEIFDLLRLLLLV